MGAELGRMVHSIPGRRIHRKKTLLLRFYNIVQDTLCVPELVAGDKYGILLVVYETKEVTQSHFVFLNYVGLSRKDCTLHTLSVISLRSSLPVCLLCLSVLGMGHLSKTRLGPLPCF